MTTKKKSVKTTSEVEVQKTVIEPVKEEKKEVKKVRIFYPPLK